MTRSLSRPDLSTVLMGRPPVWAMMPVGAGFVGLGFLGVEPEGLR